jgi:hypothetical protein
MSSLRELNTLGCGNMFDAINEIRLGVMFDVACDVITTAIVVVSDKFCH